jgi:hypothetical protein
VLIPGGSRSWAKVNFSRLPEVPDLDVQLRNGSIDVLSNRTLPVNGKRCIPGPLDKVALDDYVWLPRVAFQLDLDVPLLFGLFHKRIQVLATKDLSNQRSWRRNTVSSKTLTLGGKLRPRQIAQAILLFPVPLGPMTMFR